MLFVTGDLHGLESHARRLANKFFPQNKTLTKQDYVIVAGDFGFVWDGSKEEKYWLKWLAERNFTTLFVDGNHENFDLLYSYPVTHWNGGKVHLINESIIHLMRGQVYSIQGIKVFTFGGADSIDKELRIEGKSWWRQEMPSPQEYEEGKENLKRNNWTVDYIITHTCPTSVLRLIEERFDVERQATEINDYLEAIMKHTHYKRWYSGHEHKDVLIDDKHRILYQDVIELGC